MGILNQKSNKQGLARDSSTDFYYQTDHLGSTGYLTDKTGTLAEHIEYTPWGESWFSNPGTPVLNYKFTGKEQDNTGFYYFGARYYDPQTSVWISTDPILGKYLDSAEKGTARIYDSKNLSLYSYAANNPIIYIDPDGLLWEYSQASGNLTHIDDQTGARELVTTGFSGNGEGRNNPNMQSVQKVGPIPAGMYTIGGLDVTHDVLDENGNVVTTMNNSMTLTPDAGTETYNRNGFRIHGGNLSEGCIVTPDSRDSPDIRMRIANSGDTRLQVISGQERNVVTPAAGEAMNGANRAAADNSPAAVAAAAAAAAADQNR